MSAPFHIFDTVSEPGSRAEYIAYWCPRSLRVETFQHSEDTAQHSPDCDCFDAGPVDPFNHDGSTTANLEGNNVR